MNILEEKKLLRQEFKKRRASLSKEEVLQKSQLICENFINNLLPKILDCRVAPSAPNNDEGGKTYELTTNQSNQTIFSLYLSANKEVETKFIKEFFIKNNINFSYPKITKLNSHLDFIKYQQDLIFTKNIFFPSILEPQTGKKILPDILIIPLLAFDSDLSRLGMGGGFFDRTISFLKTKKSKIATIGLAYDMQRFEKKLAIEKTDSSLDFIVSESSIFSRN